MKQDKLSFISSKKSLQSDTNNYCMGGEELCPPNGEYNIITSFSQVDLNSNFNLFTMVPIDITVSTPTGYEQYIYLFGEESTVTVKNSLGMGFIPINQDDLNLLMLGFMNSDDLCNGLINGGNGLYLISQNGSNLRETIVVESSSSTYTLGFVSSSSNSLDLGGFRVTMNFQSSGQLKAIKIAEGETTCDTVDLSGYTSSPQIKYSGSLTNVDSLGRFVRSSGESGGDDDYDLDDFYCICKDDKCPDKVMGEATCTKVVKSISDIKEIGAVFVKGKYEIDSLSNAIIYFEAADSTITVKGSQGMYPGQVDNLTFVQFLDYSFANCDEVNKADDDIDPKYLVLYFSDHSYDLKVESQGNYNMLLDEKTVNLKKVQITLDFKKEGKLIGFSGIEDEECKDISLKDYTSEPTIKVKGKISNAKDCGGFIKKVGLSGGAIAGIVIACVVVVGAVVGVVIFLILKNKQSSDNESSKV